MPEPDELTAEEVSWLRGFRQQVIRSRFAGADLRGFLPAFQQRVELETADEGRKYQVVVIPGPPDILFVELRNDGGDWVWVPINGNYLGSGTTLTIATGAITATAGYHVVDTEAAAASDDLDTISGTVAGQLLVIRAANSARTVVAKDGTGNLKLAGDFSLDNAEDTLILISDGSTLYEVSRSDNGA